MSEVIDFDSGVSEWTQQFKYKDKSYTLTEASGGAVSRYKDGIMRNITLEDGKAVKSDGFNEPELELLAECTTVEEQGEQRTVSKLMVEKWPSRICDRLIELIKKNSEMDSDEDLESLIKKREALDAVIKQREEDTVGNVQ